MFRYIDRSPTEENSMDDTAIRKTGSLLVLELDDIYRFSHEALEELQVFIFYLHVKFEKIYHQIGMLDKHFF